MIKSDSKRDRVLIVDDEPAIRRIVVRTLAWAQVEQASSGEEAFRMAMAGAFDLIITDFDMPGMRGDRLVRLLREQRQLDHVPILLLTGVDEDHVRVDMLRHGAQDYVVKPFSHDELAARARNLIAAKRGRDALRATITEQDGDLAVARDEASRAAVAKATFLQLVSHELNTPLTALRLNLELLDRGGSLSDERQRQRVRMLGKSSDRIIQIVESVLEYTRRAGSADAVPECWVALSPFLEALVLDYTAIAAAKGLTFTAKIESELPSLPIEPQIVRCIVGNLLDNAIKFTDVGSIQLTAVRAGDNCRIDISDTGRGVQESELAAVFQPFSTKEPITGKHTPGLGLGLATVVALVEALGGQISLASNVGAGSRVQVTLPLARAPLP
jgi:signal transduction histidine kinase